MKILGFCRQMTVSRYYYDIHLYRWENWGSQESSNLICGRSEACQLLYPVILLTIWKGWEEKLSDLSICHDCIMSPLLSECINILLKVLSIFSTPAALMSKPLAVTGEIIENTSNTVQKSLLSISHSMWMEALLLILSRTGKRSSGNQDSSSLCHNALP